MQINYKQIYYQRFINVIKLFIFYCLSRILHCQGTAVADTEI